MKTIYRAILSSLTGMYGISISGAIFDKSMKLSYGTDVAWIPQFGYLLFGAAYIVLIHVRFVSLLWINKENKGDKRKSQPIKSSELQREMKNVVFTMD